MEVGLAVNFDLLFAKTELFIKIQLFFDFLTYCFAF